MVGLPPISRRDAQHFLKVLETAASRAVRGDPLLHEWVICPEGLDRGILPYLALRGNTYNALRDADLFEGTNELTVGDLLKVRGIGPRGVQDMATHLWDYFYEMSLEPLAADSASRAGRLQGDKSFKDHFREGTPEPDWQVPGVSVQESVRLLEILQTSAQSLGKTPRFTPEMAQILGTARELYANEDFWYMFAPCVRRVATVLGTHMGIMEPLQGVTFIAPGLVEIMASTAVNIYAKLPLDDRTVVDHRVLAVPVRKLAEVARFLGWSGKHVVERQLAFERALEEALDPDLELITRILQDEFAETKQPAERFCVSRLAQVFGENDSVGYSLVRRCLERRLNEAVVGSSRPTNFGYWDSDSPNVH